MHRRCHRPSRLLHVRGALTVITLMTSSGALAQHEGHQMPMPMPMPDPIAVDASAAEEMQPAAHAMTGALASYPMAREASGTAWQPDSSEHGGIHLMSSD